MARKENELKELKTELESVNKKNDGKETEALKKKAEKLNADIEAQTTKIEQVETEVEVARRENPHERQIAYVAARPTAPPLGSRLETDEPHRLTTSALLWVRPGSEPVKVKV